MPHAIKKIKLDQQEEPGEEPPRSFDRDSPIPLKNLGNTCYENSIIQCLFSLDMFMDNFERSMENIRKCVVKPNSKPINVLSVNDVEQQPQQEIRNEQNGIQLKAKDDHLSDRLDIQENDVRFRIAVAFDNLYKSYTRKRIKAETNGASGEKETTVDSKIDQQESYPETHQEGTVDARLSSFQNLTPAAIHHLPTTSTKNITATESLFQVQNSEGENGKKPFFSRSEPFVSSNVEDSTINVTSNPPTPKPMSIPTATTSNFTPIALMSSNLNSDSVTSTNNVTNDQQSEVETRLEDLKSAVGDRSSQFNSTHQQDASEFFYHVIDSIQEFYQSLNKTKDEDNPVTKAFELELDYLIKCPKCHHQTLSGPEKLRTLPLALPHLVNEELTSITSTTTPTIENDHLTKPSSPNHINGYNHETNGAPTPPTSDLGLDSPESSTYEEQNQQQQHPKPESPNQLEVVNDISDVKENQALSNDENQDNIREDNSSNNSLSKNTMSIAKLELSDETDYPFTDDDSIETEESQTSSQVRQEIQSEQQTEPQTNSGIVSQIESNSEPHKSSQPENLKQGQQSQEANQSNKQPNEMNQKQYTLTDALNNYFRDELLECNCSQDGCDSKQRTKKCMIRKLPQVLFMTLARYSYTGKKNLDEIEAPFELYVPFRENKSPSHSPTAHSNFENDDCNMYRLIAVVSHHGSSLNAGHYTSYVYNQNNSSWYCCDDDSITKVQEADVKSDATKTGYCFFYAQNSCVDNRNSLKKCQSITTQQDVVHERLQKETALQENEVSKNESMVIKVGVAADSSVVLTPESSPSPSNKSTQDSEPEITLINHQICYSNNDEIDDWS